MSGNMGCKCETNLPAGLFYQKTCSSQFQQPEY